MTPKKILKTHWRLLLPLALMVIIFLFSADSSPASSAKSTPLAEFLNLPEWLIRKSAHAIIFASLGASWHYYFRATLKSTPAFNLTVPLLLSILYALIDEFHQTSVPGRAGLVSDVFLDSAAALAGILIFAALYYATRTPAQKSIRKKHLAKIWHQNQLTLQKSKIRPRKNRP